MKKANSVGAVIVLYNPVFEDLKNAIDKLYPQVDTICLVDNSSVDNINKIKILEKINYIPLCENSGIAKAQNIGIKYLQEKGCQFILFCDQDSSCEDGLIQELINVFIELENKGYKIAVIGPTPVNKYTAKPYITPKNILKQIDLQLNDKDYKVLEMHSVISSYSITRLSVYEEVGYMEEDLFIDGVDDEWCWRARYNSKRKSFLILNLQFQHFQGSQSNLSIKKTTPFRTYYQYRNFIRLSKRCYTPRYWKIKNFCKFVIKILFYPIFISPRLQYLKNTLRGIYDGIKYK